MTRYCEDKESARSRIARDEAGRATTVMLAVLAVLVVAGIGIGGYIDGFYGGGAIPPGTTAAATQAQPDGEVLFQGHCGSCHTLAEAQTKGRQGPNLDALKPNTVETFRIIQDGGQIMPAGILTGEQATQVSRYVSQVAGASQ